MAIREFDVEHSRTFYVEGRAPWASLRIADQREAARENLSITQASQQLGVTIGHFGARPQRVLPGGPQQPRLLIEPQAGAALFPADGEQARPQPLGGLREAPASPFVRPPDMTMRALSRSAF